MIESRQRFDEEIAAFVAEFITPCRKKVESFVQIKVQMTKKLTVKNVGIIIFRSFYLKL